MMTLRLLLLLFVAYVIAQDPYIVVVSNKGAVPSLSIKNPIGSGFTPCEYTFNPAYLPASPGLNQSSELVLKSCVIHAHKHLNSSQSQ